MSLVHNLYVGHFIPEKGYVRFQGHKPAVTRCIDRATATALLKKYLGDRIDLEELSSLWGMSILPDYPDYIVCDYLGSPAEALRFAADYAEQTGAILLNLGSFSLMNPAQVRESANVRAASLAGVETATRSGS